MDRTTRAALVAGLFGLVVVGGIARFLGLTTQTAMGSGVVAAVVLAGLILAAARRADDGAPGGQHGDVRGRRGDAPGRPDDAVSGGGGSRPDGPRGQQRGDDQGPPT